MKNAFQIGRVNHCATALTDSWKAVKLLVKGERLNNRAVSIRDEQSPTGRMISRIDDTAARTPREPVVAVEPASQHRLRIVGRVSRTHPNAARVVALHRNYLAAIARHRSGQVLAQII